MNIKNVKIDTLIPYVNNPRNNTDAIDKVASSIKEFGFRVPIVIDKNNIVVTGHTRLLASKKLGLEEVPVIVADDLTEAQIKAFRIADNKVSEYSTWDIDLLRNELDMLEELNFDLDLVNIDYSDFAGMDIDLEDIPQELELKTTEQNITPTNKLKIGSYEIKLTDEEYMNFTNEIEKYVAKTGVLYGFVSELLERSLRND